jgi:hypothetical protein
MNVLNWHPVGHNSSQQQGQKNDYEQQMLSLARQARLNDHRVCLDDIMQSPFTQRSA